MSHCTCEHCGAILTDSPRGYVTGCVHYPADIGPQRGKRSVYANEIDPKAAHWLSCLPIPFDFVDERSIKDVTGNDVIGFKQCHFFAGIGGWPLALEMAGWPDDAPVWTGSCPCQPFSAAGKRKGVADERHLWPEFLRLIDECRPATVFGEQVASKDGRDWLAAVRTDLEALGYAVGAADLCAAGVGAPHIRQRLFWVAHSGSTRLEERQEQPARKECQAAERSGDAVGMADAKSFGGFRRVRCQSDESQWNRGSLSAGPGNWAGVEYIECSDGKARPIKPGVCVLAHGVSGRVAQLRGLGNAIVPQLAAVFIESVMDVIFEPR